MLTIADAVEQNHVQAPKSTAVILGGISAFYKEAKIPAPRDLPTQVANARTADQLAALLEPMLKNADAKTVAKLQTTLFHGMQHAVPGGFAVMETPSRKESAVQEQFAANR